jgi:phosphate-selective porin OprO and OprP
MVRMLHKLALVFGMVLMPYFAVSSWAEGQQNQTQLAASTQESQIEQLKQEIEAIQNQNQKQIEDLQKKIQDLEAKKAPTAPPPSQVFLKNFDAGYDEGLYIKTTDNRYMLKFNGLFQFYMPQIQDFSDNTKKAQDENIAFEVRRLRLIFSGNGFFPWLKYFVQMGADKGGSFQLFDAYMDWGYKNYATPRFGQYKVPFNREELTGDAYLEFTAERSIVNDQFTIERDIGASLYGSLFDNTLAMFEYYGGIFNGAGRNSAGGVNGTNLLYAGRIMWEPLGKYPYVQGDLLTGLKVDQTKPLLAVAAAFAYFPNYNPITENQNNRVNLSNTVLAINKNAQSADVFQFTADLGFKYEGFGFEAEYDLQRIGDIVSVAPTTGAQTEQGIRAQLGYIFLPTHFEAAFRYAYVKNYCQNNITNVGCQKEQEYSPAINYYFYAHRLKVGAMYSYLRQNAPSLDGHVFDNRIIFFSQIFF